MSLKFESHDVFKLQQKQMNKTNDVFKLQQK